jgi:hypothetical protein
MTMSLSNRLVGWALGLLLLVVAAVHVDLYAADDYRFIPTIGWLFLLTAVVATVLAAVLALQPIRAVAGIAGLFCLGVLGGYVLSLTLPDGIFSFREPGVSAAGWVAIVAESGVALIAGGSLLASRRSELSGHRWGRRSLHRAPDRSIP